MADYHTPKRGPSPLSGALEKDLGRNSPRSLLPIAEDEITDPRSSVDYSSTNAILAGSTGANNSDDEGLEESGDLTPRGSARSPSIPYSKPTIDIPDKSKWMEMLEASSPVIRDVRRRVRPLTRTLDLARTFELAPHYPEALIAAVAPPRDNPAEHAALIATLLQRPGPVESQMVMLLVLEHLQFLNMNQTLSVLRQELQRSVKFTTLQEFDPTDTDPYALDHQESRLVSTLRSAMRRAHRVWDHTMNDKFDSSQDNAYKLDELMYSLGLIDEGSGSANNDLDIWSEPEDGTVVFDSYVPVEEGEPPPIRAASLNKLVQKLTGEMMPDLTFISTFLLTYRSFATPKKLLEKLQQRFNVPQGAIDSRGKKNNGVKDEAQWVRTIQLRVISFLKKWIEEYRYDIDASVAIELKAFVEEAAYINPALSRLCSALLNHLQRPVKKVQSVVHQTLPPAPKVPKDIFSSTLTLYSIDPEEVARQLTLMDIDVYCAIKPSELLNQSWNKAALKHRAPNILKMIHAFNQLSHSITTHIVKPTKMKYRAHVLDYWVKVAQYLHELNNFHGMMAVVSGVNAGPALRLKHTRGELNKQSMEAFEALERTMESDGSFATYRALLSTTAPPCIPHLGIHLTDLVFIEDGNKDLDGSLINFAKRRLLAASITQLRRYQQPGCYNFQPVHQVKELIMRLRPMEIKELYKVSQLREPRDAPRSQIQ